MGDSILPHPVGTQCTMSQKNKTPYSSRQLREILIDFQNSFSDRLSTKVLQNNQYISHTSYRHCYTTSCETVMFQKSIKFKNTLGLLAFINKILLQLVKESRFSLTMFVKEEPEYYKLVLNIL